LLYGNKNFLKGFGAGLVSGAVGGVFSGVSAGIGNVGFGVPSILIDGVGNVASNAASRSMGFSSKSDGAAFFTGIFNGGLRVGIRTLSAKISGAEFQRSKYNTVGVAHRDTHIYKDLEASGNNPYALEYRQLSEAKYTTDGDLNWKYEGSSVSDTLSLSVNETSQFHDGFNGLVYHGGAQWLMETPFNELSMIPSYAIVQHLDQGSFWNNYETYR